MNNTREIRRILLLYGDAAHRCITPNREHLSLLSRCFYIRDLTGPCTGQPLGCTIDYTGAWLAWKCFLLKVFSTLWGVRQKQWLSHGAASARLISRLPYKRSGNNIRSVTARIGTCDPPQKRLPSD